MGNTLGCSGLGERLAAAARDGDEPEARQLLAASPGLARYATFGALNSPLHFAAAKGHNEIGLLLLENGADVNSKNIYGQTPLMQACRFGRWEVVQTLLVFRCNVLKADNLSCRTALHFAAGGGHVKCVRLLLADAVADKDSFVNKAASGGVTALHVAALHGHVDCVHLLLDGQASTTSLTLPYASSPMGSIGAGSTPLHYAACGGNVKCCQVLVARGADRSAMNCNGWLPLDVARIWGCHWLDHVLSPKSLLPMPKFPPSSYLSLPLISILGIAREHGLKSSLEPSYDPDDADADACAVCLERSCDVAAEGCGHELCMKCALDLCTSIKAYDVSGIPGSIPCPLCRSGIVSFRKVPASALNEHDLNLASCHCKNCSSQLPSDLRKSMSICRSAHCQNYIDAVTSEMINSLSCAPFPSSAILS